MRTKKFTKPSIFTKKKKANPKMNLYISKNISEPIDTIIVNKIRTDDYMSNKEGHWFGNKDYIKTIHKNTDCVYLDNNNLNTTQAR